MTDELAQQEPPLDPEYRLTVYKYGARKIGPSAQEKKYPVLPSATTEQLFLCHRMRNDLVAMDKDYETSIKTLWDTIPELAEITTAITTVSEEVDELVAKTKTQSQQRRSKDKVDTSLKTALKDKRAELKVLRTRLKELKNERFSQIEEQIADLRNARKAKIKEIRQDYASRGLYWGTYNLVIDHHATAVKNITARRKAGQPAGHTFHRWEGAGTLAVQLQRGATDPPRSPDVLAAGTSAWRNVVQVAPYMTPEQWEALPKATRRKMAAQGLVKMRVSGTDHVELPVSISRMLPIGADVTGVQLTQQKVGQKTELSVAVTARVPKPKLRDTGPTVAVHLGWRVRPDGSLRVATFVSKDKLPAPNITKFLAGTIQVHGNWGEVIVPRAWREEFVGLDDIRSVRDKSLEQIKALVGGYLSAGAVFPEYPDLTAGLVSKIRSQSHLYTLSNKLFESKQIRGTVEADPGLVTLEEQLFSWAAADQGLWNREARNRKNLIRRRIDGYRRITAWLARFAQLIVVDDMDLASLASVKDTDDQQLAIARRNRVIAAPGDLRQYLENACSSYGAAYQKGAGSASRLTHYVCGTATASADEYAASVMVRCRTCNTEFDQDVNMGHLLLANLS